MLNFRLKPAMLVRILFVLLSLLLAWQPASAQHAAPGAPRALTFSWKKDYKDPNCQGNPPVCKLSLSVAPSMQGAAATSYEWEIWRLGNIELSKITRGTTWLIGYLEPTDTYTVKVRAVNACGSSPELVRTVASPTGCCIK